MSSLSNNDSAFESSTYSKNGQSDSTNNESIGASKLQHGRRFLAMLRQRRQPLRSHHDLSMILSRPRALPSLIPSKTESMCQEQNNGRFRRIRHAKGSPLRADTDPRTTPLISFGWVGDDIVAHDFLWLECYVMELLQHIGLQ